MYELGDLTDAQLAKALEVMQEKLAERNNHQKPGGARTLSRLFAYEKALERTFQRLFCV